MVEKFSLNNHFLIAMPHMDDTRFTQAVVLICEHTARGAMGIVVNHPMDLSLNQLFTHLDISAQEPIFTKEKVYAGGPLQKEHGFVLHSTDTKWGASFPVTESLTLSVSKDILTAIAQKEGPSQALIALGCAGWSAGQLETELANNVWLSVPADPNIIFDLPPYKRWRAALEIVGINPDHLVAEVGHA